MGGLRTKIVVGMDLSEAGDRALTQALRLTRATRDAELHPTFVHAVSADIHSARKLAGIAEDLPAALKALRERVDRVVATEATREPIECDATLHVRLGPPAQAIVDRAVEVGAALIVVGTHARRGLPKLLLGSIAEEVLRLSPIPVVVVSLGPDRGAPAREVLRHEALSEAHHLTGPIR